MKRITDFLTALVIASALTCCGDKVNKTASSPTSSGNEREPYFIVVAPWSGDTKSGKFLDVENGNLLNALVKWSKTQVSKQKFEIESFASSDSKIQADDPTKTDGLVLNLTASEASHIETHFKFPIKGKAADILIGRNRIYEPVPLALTAPLAAPPPGWAVNLMVAANMVVDQLRTEAPVLYVVDTGVMPFALKSGSDYEMSKQFKNITLRQGQCTPAGSGQWPPSGAGVWSTGANLSLPLGSQFTLYTGTSLNPMEDAFAHGTQIASAAVGVEVGIMGKLSQTSGSFTPLPVEIESIRVFTSPSGGSAEHPPIPTTSQVIYNGILKAIGAHQTRCASNSKTAPSVLVFASRTLSGFDQVVEKNLWYAWNQGIIVVASAGNEPNAISGMQPPNAMWWSAQGVMASPASTTPARYDWTNPNIGFWPFTLDRPQSRYMALVAGNNMKWNTSSNALEGTDGFRPGSSIGPDIDILTPSTLVPCAKVKSNGYTYATGSSISAGYVAGAALAFLACTQDVNNPPSAAVPNAFLEWLTPLGGPAHACEASANAAGWTGGNFRKSYYTDGTMDASYNGKVPKLKLTMVP